MTRRGSRLRAEIATSLAESSVEMPDVEMEMEIGWIVFL